MFYDFTLLTQRHNGRLGVAWLAGTRGIKLVQDAQVQSVDLLKLCEDIINYAISRGGVRERISLRLSSFLTSGTVRLQHRKAAILLNDIVRVFGTIQKPVRITISPADSRSRSSESDDFETPPTPKPVPKRQRRPRLPIAAALPSTPEELRELIQQDDDVQMTDLTEAAMAGVIARADEITIREPVASIKIETETPGFGDLGAGLDDDSLSQVLGATVPPLLRSSRTSPSRSILVTIAEIHPEPPSSREEPQIVREPEPEIVITAEPETAVVEMREAEPRPRPIVRTPEPIREAPAKIRRPVTKTKTAALEGKLLPRNVHINRINDNVIEICQAISTVEIESIRRGFKSLHLAHILEKYFIREEDSASVRSESISVARASVGEVNTSSALPTPSKPQFRPYAESTPTELLVQTKRKETTPEEEIPDVEQSKRRRLRADISAMGQQEIIPAQMPMMEIEEIPFFRPQFPDEIVPTDSIQEETEFVLSARQQVIVEKVRTSDTFLTIEEVAEMPINRLNIARAFGDLLQASKHGWVALFPMENELQLKHIGKGPKLINL